MIDKRTKPILHVGYRCLFFSVMACLLQACGGTRLDAEQENLEKPPRLVDFSAYKENFSDQNDSKSDVDPDADDQQQIENFDVLLTKEDGKNTSLAIVQSYDKAWLMVAKALNSDAFDITDRDRDAGLFYVSYDPDFEQSGWEKTSSFFLGGLELVSDFKLKLTDVDTITEITAELIVDEDEDEQNLSDPDVEVEKFLLELYRILRVQ